MKRNYDTIAGFYDQLARLIFGKTLINTQQYLVAAIPPASHILIIGGGTGWILEEITKAHPAGLTITYVDASAKMVALARKRKYGANRVNFIAAPFETVSVEAAFDVVLTPFLFDNFKEDSLRTTFTLIDSALKPQALWLYSDFQYTGKLWQKFMLTIMYIFFRTTCGIEAAQLPDVNSIFSKYKYEIKTQRTFMSQFVTAVIYRKA